jgi:chorismate-pyruvate lyase
MRRDSRTHSFDVHNARPPHALPRNGRAVPLEPSLRRAVLATDGTVTNLIESFLEPVAVEKLSEEHVIAPLPEWPELPRGTPVVRRTVVIRGAGSGRIFLHAESLLVLERLAPDIRHELLATAKPIGKLIREHKIESYRELLGAVNEAAGSRAAALGIDPAEELVARTYRIHFGGQPAIQITERFLACDAGEI